MLPQHLKFMNFIEQLGLCDVFLLNLTTTCGGILLSLESNICQISIEYIDQTSLKYFIIYISLKGGQHCRVCSNVGSNEGKQERGNELWKGQSEKRRRKNQTKRDKKATNMSELLIPIIRSFETWKALFSQKSLLVLNFSHFPFVRKIPSIFIPNIPVTHNFFPDTHIY